MISIIFPPGAYGHYLSSCLYAFTELSDKDFLPKIEVTGSSHSIAENEDFIKKIQKFHAPLTAGRFFDASKMTKEKTIAIIPSDNEWLDYFDNVLRKTYFDDVIEHITVWWPRSQINEKLKKFGSDIEKADRWAVREYVSFWMMDFFNNAFAKSKFQVDSVYMLEASDIISNKFKIEFLKIVNLLNLETKNLDYFDEHHLNFLKHQTFVGMQNKCIQWVQDAIENISSDSPCITIYDEAYVQHLLRERGYEIESFNLINFPPNSDELAKIMKPVSQG